jgi:hypothetical protein
MKRSKKITKEDRDLDAKQPYLQPQARPHTGAQGGGGAAALVAGGAGAPATQELHCGEKRREKDEGNLLGCSPSADFEQKRRISRVKVR